MLLGQVCIDHNAGERSTYVSWGSPVLYIAQYFREFFGVNPRIITRYGADFIRHSKDFLLHPATPNSERTLIYKNIMTKGVRSQYCFNRTAVPQLFDEMAKKYLTEADIVFFAPLTPDYSSHFVSRAIAETPSACLKVLLPQGFFRQIDANGFVRPREFEEARAILPHFDLVVLSDEDHPNALAEAGAWQQYNPEATCIVTQNAQGARIIQSGNITSVPTRPVRPKDIVSSVGCGDVFSASAAWHFFQTNNIIHAVKEGHAAARKKLLTSI